MSSGRTGRRPGNQDTREQILTAARSLFARKGFKAASIRAIAGAAGVNVALVGHYFGNKEKLFAAAQQLPNTVRDSLAAALRGDTDTAGERLTRAYFGLWEDDATRPQILATVRSVISGETGTDLIRDMLAGVMDSDGTGVTPSQHRGLTLAMGELLGTAILRHITRLPPIEELDFDDLVAAVAPAVQLLLDQSP